jgi:deoxyribose-phosphate aldolase
VKINIGREGGARLSLNWDKQRSEIMRLVSIKNSRNRTKIILEKAKLDKDKIEY